MSFHSARVMLISPLKLSRCSSGVQFKLGWEKTNAANVMIAFRVHVYIEYITKTVWYFEAIHLVSIKYENIWYQLSMKTLRKPDYMFSQVVDASIPGIWQSPPSEHQWREGRTSSIHVACFSKSKKHGRHWLVGMACSSWQPLLSKGLFPLARNKYCISCVADLNPKILSKAAWMLHSIFCLFENIMILLIYFTPFSWNKRIYQTLTPKTPFQRRLNDDCISMLFWFLKDKVYCAGKSHTRPLHPTTAWPSWMLSCNHGLQEIDIQSFQELGVGQLERKIHIHKVFLSWHHEWGKKRMLMISSPQPTSCLPVVSEGLRAAKSTCNKVCNFSGAVRRKGFKTYVFQRWYIPKVILLEFPILEAFENFRNFLKSWYLHVSL